MTEVTEQQRIAIVKFIESNKDNIIGLPIIVRPSLTTPSYNGWVETTPLNEIDVTIKIRLPLWKEKS
jgi:hypothetical protein